jgi:hypothetical protein
VTALATDHHQNLGSPFYVAGGEPPKPVGVGRFTPPTPMNFTSLAGTRGSVGAIGDIRRPTVAFPRTRPCHFKVYGDSLTRSPL